MSYLNNIKSAKAYYETAKTYALLASTQENILKRKLEHERFKAIIEVIRIISVVDLDEGYEIYHKLFEFDLSKIEKYMMKNENLFFHNTYVKKEKKILHPWVYLVRKFTKSQIYYLERRA